MKTKIINMLNDLHNLPQKTEQDLWKDIVTDRLEASYNVYEHELNNSIQYLTRKRETTVLRQLNKLKINEQTDK